MTVLLGELTFERLKIDNSKVDRYTKKSQKLKAQNLFKLGKKLS